MSGMLACDDVRDFALLKRCAQVPRLDCGHNRLKTGSLPLEQRTHSGFRFGSGPGLVHVWTHRVFHRDLRPGLHQPQAGDHEVVSEKHRMTGTHPKLMPSPRCASPVVLTKKLARRLIADDAVELVLEVKDFFSEVEGRICATKFLRRRRDGKRSRSNQAGSDFPHAPFSIKPAHDLSPMGGYSQRVSTVRPARCVIPFSSHNPTCEGRP